MGAGLVFVGVACVIALIKFAIYIFHDPELSAGKIITDTKTGCQYVAYGSGVTPRLDTAGKQICTLPSAK